MSAQNESEEGVLLSLTVSRTGNTISQTGNGNVSQSVETVASVAEVI